MAEPRKSPPITHEDVRRHFDYDPETGLFRRLLGRIGPTGFKCRRGYMEVSLFNLTYKAHRLAWFYMTGEWPKGQIDHINRQKDDNRWCNLRDVSGSVNQHNRGLEAVPQNRMSGFRGVRKRDRQPRYHASITVDGDVISLGGYETAEEAHAAYVGARTLALSRAQQMSE